MTQGTPRRTVPQLRLQGTSDVVPNTAPASGQVAAGFRPANLSGLQRLNGAFGKFASDKIAEAANISQERAHLDGQMAFQQGRAIEELEMEGNKFALDGYRVMQAQTLSASMLTAQQELIKLRKHEDSPEAFRAQYVDMLEQQIEGLDPTTARMVQETMTKQMVPLVSQHTAQHMAWKEEQAYQALVSSVATLSADATGSEALLSNMQGGPGSPSSGLSEERRKSAVADGIMAALDTGNARALAIASTAGVISGFTETQKAKVRRANEAYKNKLRRELSVQQTAQLREVQEKIASGDLSGFEAADAIANLYTSFGVEATPEMLSSAYSAGADAQDTVLDGMAFEAEIAAATGDIDTLYKAVLPALIKQESGGNPDAVSPSGAEGLMQVMPLTQKDPGFGIRPSDGSKADTIRVGEEYLRLLLSGNKGHESFNWEPGDLDAALIAYNAGHVNAKKWIMAGRDYSVLPKREETEPYVKNIRKFMGLNLSASEKRARSIARAKEQQAKAKALQEAAFKEQQMASYEAYQTGFAALTRTLETTGDREAFRAAEKELRRSTGVELSKAMIQSVETQVRKSIDAEIAGVDADTKAIFETEAVQIIELAKLGLEAEGITSAGADQVVSEAMNQLDLARQRHGLPLADADLAKNSKTLLTALRETMGKERDKLVEQAEIDYAVRNGAVSALPRGAQETYWKQQRQTLFETAKKYQANNPEASQEELVQVHRTAKLSTYAQSGAVDPIERERLSSTLTGTLLNSKGEARKDSIEAIEDYAYLKQSNPRVAERLMSEKARARAEAVLAEVGGDVSQIAEGISALDANLKAAAVVNTNAADLASEVSDAAESLLEDSTTDVLDWIFGEGSFQNYVTTTDDALAAYEQATEDGTFTAAIQAEAERIGRRQPGLDGRTLVNMAKEKVARRTAHVGDSVIVKMQGPDLATQLFGDRANDMFQPGVENEAITAWLRHEAQNNPAMAAASGLTTLEIAKEAFTDGIVPALSSAMNRGVRQFEPFVVGDQMFVRFIMSGGARSEAIPVDLAAAGRLYMDAHRQALID